MSKPLHTHLSKKIPLLIDAAIEHWLHLEGKYLHHLQIIVPLDNDSSAEDLNDLIRKLVNSKQSRNCVDNRSWWNANFAGGCYIVAIQQQSPESGIKAVYDLICVSEHEHLDGTMEEMQKRLIKVVSKATSSICSSIELDEEKVLVSMVTTVFGKISNFFFESEPFKKINTGAQRWVLEAVGRDVQCLGVFYLMLHQPYNL